MYDTLLQLPLFQGFCKNDFTQVLEKVRFHFRKYKADEQVVNQGEACNDLIFLLSGEVNCLTADENNRFSIEERLVSPTVLEPHSIFGMNTTYTASYKAHTDISVVTISKSYLLTELSTYEIFRMNYYNILSNRVQVAYGKLWSNLTGTTLNRIAFFLSQRMLLTSGEKRICIKMDDLATLIDDTRINVSKALNELQEKGIVKLSRKEILIPSFEKLLEQTGTK
ncbi:MAG: Crp/Fnr family transcriptional regulator [Phocaeicola sp.]